MTSLAVLPQLKRTLTDSVEEDLYHLPNSPINVQNAGTTTPLRADSPKPFFRHNNASLLSSPALNYTSMQLGNANNLSSLLNIPDSFADQYGRGPSLNVTSLFPSSATALAPWEDVEEYYPSQNTNISPFADYGNPDSLNVQQPMSQSQFAQKFPVVSNPPASAHTLLFTRRRRITTLELDDPMTKGDKKNKDDDYYLFNTDVQPSHLGNNAGFFDADLYGDSLFVPNIAPSDVNASDIPIPGFENDYLLIDDFEEDVEEDLSDDDDDNYFHDDDEFDEFIMNNNDYHPQFPTTTTERQVVPSNDREAMATDFISGGFIDDFGIKNSSVTSIIAQDDEVLVKPDDDAMMVDVNEEAKSKGPAQVSQQFTPPESLEATPSEEFSLSSLGPSDHFLSAAEILAVNPNHQCDLINPATGVPCNKQFSRPYDLIRHQETIHSSKKKIFRCVICEGRLNGGMGNGKLKTFSRGDALSRHIKVKHGLGGKDAIDLINRAKENVEYVFN